MSDETSQKIRTVSEAAEMLEPLRDAGKRIVMCHGVFDLLHLGHIRYLNSAKKKGDILVVTSTADRHVKRGPGRPVFNQDQRAEALANLAVTDIVCVADSPTAIEAINKIKPHIYIKGPDYKNRIVDDSSRLLDEERAVNQWGGELLYTDDITFSSSELINKYFHTYPEPTHAYLKEMSASYTPDDIKRELAKVKDLKILLVGDTIIDQYCYCSPLGKSAKENIVANLFTCEETYAGGALATANHIAQICDNLHLLTVLGAKDSYEDFIRKKLDPKISTTFIVRPDTTTTLKRRYVRDEDKKKLFEICYLDDSDLPKDQEEQALEFLEREIANYDLVIVNDFGHGMLTAPMRTLICNNAKLMALNSQTNSANIGFNLITKYTRTDMVCIDAYELRLAAREKNREIPVLMQKLYYAMGPEIIICTLGAGGSVSFTKNLGYQQTPAFTSTGIDKVGAGDAFFAYAAPCFAAGVPQELIGLISNAVGAMKIQIIGNKEPVRKGDLCKFITRLLKV